MNKIVFYTLTAASLMPIISMASDAVIEDPNATPARRVAAKEARGDYRDKFADSPYSTGQAKHIDLQLYTAEHAAVKARLAVEEQAQKQHEESTQRLAVQEEKHQEEMGTLKSQLLLCKEESKAEKTKLNLASQTVSRLEGELTAVKNQLETSQSEKAQFQLQLNQHKEDLKTSQEEYENTRTALAQAEENAQAQDEAHKAKIKELRQELEKKSATVARREQLIAFSEGKLNEAIAHFNQASSQVAHLTTSLAQEQALKTELADKVSKLAEQNGLLRAHILDLNPTEGVSQSTGDDFKSDDEDTTF